MNYKAAAITALLFFCTIFLQASVPVYKQKDKPVEERVEDLLSRMTLEEKLAQMSHLHARAIFDGKGFDKVSVAEICGNVAKGFAECFLFEEEGCDRNFYALQRYFVEKTRLGIPALILTESLHGSVQLGSTIYPQNIALGSTFNPELAYRKTSGISGELHANNIRQVLAPCIDVVRDLRWGRVEESFGEDPLLCGQMGLQEVKGYRDHHISPMIKHFGAHGNPNGGLNLASVNCGVRDLIDVYLKPFEMIVKGTDVKTVMSSYNSVDRVPNSASSFLMEEILRNRWGFTGLVYSDWAAVSMLQSFHKVAASPWQAAAMALKAGLDAEASSDCFDHLPEALERGEVSMEDIDQAVRRILRVKFELGLFEHPYGLPEFAEPIHSPEHIQVSKQIALESLVLLKNQDNLLPLDPDKLNSIAVIGPNADQVQFGDYSWSKDNADGVTPLAGIRNYLKGKVKVNYAYGCSYASLDESQIPEAVRVAESSDAVVLCCGSSSTRFVRPTDVPSNCGEGMDLNSIELTGAQSSLIKAVCATGKPVILVLVAGKPFAIPWEKEHVPAIMVQWYGGEEAGNALAETLFGANNPSGKLNFSFPQSTGHLPVYYNHLPTDKGYYGKPGSYEKLGRDYVFSSPAPLWAFGHGLSYTEFEWLDFKADRQRYGQDDTIHVTAEVRNSGQRDGKVVVQVYAKDKVSSVVTPVRKLVAFAKPFIRKGETVEVTLDFPVHEFDLVDEMGRKFFEAGEFELQLGAASDDIRKKLTIGVGDFTPLAKVNKDKEIRYTRPLKQPVKITGTVRDVQATPLAGVEICSAYSGKCLGKTDSRGVFAVRIAPDDHLLFQCPGYGKVIAEVSARKNMNIQMENVVLN